MKIAYPCIITPRLLPGVRIDNAFVSIGYYPGGGKDGRIRYQYYIDGGDFSHQGHDLACGPGGNLQEGLQSLIDFLAACGTAYRYKLTHHHDPENLDLFPPEVASWAYENEYHLSMLAYELALDDSGIIEE